MSIALQPLSLATSVMQRTFTAANAEMGSALERLSSGKRFSYASEDLTSFIKVTDLDIDQADYSRRNIGLKQASAELGMALGAANNIMDDLKEMKKAWAESEAAVAGSSAQLAAQEKAEALGASIVEALALAYDGNTLIQSGAYRDVEMAAGGTLSLDFTIGGTMVAGTEADTTAAQDAIDGLAEWIGIVGGLKAQVDSQQKMAETMLSNSQALSSAITSIDEAAETARYVDASVRQQASLSMMSQANMARQSILLLYK